jgi:acylphosphatase
VCQGSDWAPVSEIRRSVTVRGLVQGVSFRWYTCRQAERLGLSGWVRNQPDGSVRLEVQGRPDDVEELVAWARDGPPHARVSSVEVTELAADAEPAGFEIVG